VMRAAMYEIMSERPHSPLCPMCGQHLEVCTVCPDLESPTWMPHGAAQEAMCPYVHDAARASWPLDKGPAGVSEAVQLELIRQHEADLERSFPGRRNF